MNRTTLSNLLGLVAALGAAGFLINLTTPDLETEKRVALGVMWSGATGLLMWAGGAGVARHRIPATSRVADRSASARRATRIGMVVTVVALTLITL